MDLVIFTHKKNDKKVEFGHNIVTGHSVIAISSRMMIDDKSKIGRPHNEK